MLHDRVRAASVAHDAGDGAFPSSVERGKIVLADFGDGGTLRSSFPPWLLDGTRPTRAAWLLNTRIVPLVRWRGMPRGRGRLAQPERVAAAPTA